MATRAGINLSTALIENVGLIMKTSFVKYGQEK
jgi:hypothetical protein